MNSLSEMQFIWSRSRNFLAQLKNSDFVRNLFVVMSGTALAQILGFALSPIISRLYSPTDFGIFGSFSAISEVFAAGITLDYSQALMLPKRRDVAFDLFLVSCLAGILIAVLCLVICLVVPGSILNLIKAPSAWILWLLVIGIFVAGFNQSFQAWCVRVKAFKRTSISQVVRSLSANGTQIGLGFLKGGGSALIVAVVLGGILATLNLVKIIQQELKARWRGIRLKRLWQLAKEYHDFPLYSASSVVINQLSVGLPVLLLAHFYGLAVAGAYAFSIRLIQAPQGLISRALRLVLYQKASEIHNRGARLFPLYRKSTLGLFGVGSVPSLVLVLWAPQIFSSIFGAQWHTAGILARSLVLWLLFASCNLPAVLFSRIVRLQRMKFFYEQTLLIIRTLVLFLGGMYLPVSQTIVLFSLVGAGMNAAFIIMIGSAVMKREKGMTSKDIINALSEK